MLYNSRIEAVTALRAAPRACIESRKRSSGFTVCVRPRLALLPGYPASSNWQAMEPPSITFSAEDGTNCEGATKTVKFQCGLLRETETFSGEDLDVLCKDTLLDFICDMLTNKVSVIDGRLARDLWVQHVCVG